ncbi:hypothetical protein [Sphingobacterium sp. BIGb0165]|uniref:hypothetical protein n=1 Tax=Sphingobacterium sp. BIGb0165 TaxID=2940615 RepID=UPI00216A0FD4|nr:hypothetical protein [Sphingobacterium sp. BIGb0165]MCS4225054.1 hypothetical protein [Sphingobacterium sp. BIGb0165]
MAILHHGPNGPITGKFGSVNAYILNGQNVARGQRKKRTSLPTEKELVNRRKQKVAGEFAKFNYPILDFGYQYKSKKGDRIGAFQLAQRHIFPETLELDAENKPFVNPEKLLVFAGNLLPLADCQIEKEGDILHLKWTAVPIYNGHLFKVNLALINLDGTGDMKTAIAEVNQGSISIRIPGLNSKKFDYHVYVCVWDTFLGEFSNSTYCGLV